MKVRMTPLILSHICAMVLVSSIVGAIGYTVSAHSDPPPSPFIVATRDHLRVCVHVLPSVQTAAAPVFEAIAKSIARVEREHADWHPAGYGIVPEVEPCPAAIPSFDATDLDAAARMAADQAPAQPPLNGATAQPPKWKTVQHEHDASPYRTVIYVVDDNMMRMVLRAPQAQFFPVELRCDSPDDCSTVTQGLAITSEYLEDPQFTNYHLPLALGLQPLQDDLDTEQHRPDEER